MFIITVPRHMSSATSAHIPPIHKQKIKSYFLSANRNLPSPTSRRFPLFLLLPHQKHSTTTTTVATPPPPPTIPAHPQSQTSQITPPSLLPHSQKKQNRLPPPAHSPTLHDGAAARASDPCTRSIYIPLQSPCHRRRRRGSCERFEEVAAYSRV